MKTQQLVVTGTDTDVGKTIFCAGLCAASGANYWKPVQSGLDSIDSATLRQLTDARIMPESYRFSQPLSPHRAAELDGKIVEPDVLVPPHVDGPLIIEGAGGVLTPLTREMLYADLFGRWRLPVVLCARTGLGTINHSLLSIEALRNRQVPIMGIAFIGDANHDNEETICAFGKVKRLGRLPTLDPLTGPALRDAFNAHFNLRDFGL